MRRVKSRRLEVYFNKGVLKNFAKFTETYDLWSKVFVTQSF